MGFEIQITGDFGLVFWYKYIHICYNIKFKNAISTDIKNQ